MPTFIPVQGQTPDLPGTPDGLVSPGWIKYPKTLFQAVKDPPGAGGDVTLTVETNNPPWPPLEQNAQLQALNKAMNVKLNVIQSRIASPARYGVRSVHLASRNAGTIGVDGRVIVHIKSGRSLLA